MTVDNIIKSVFDAEDFAQYEQAIYEKYQVIAENDTNVIAVIVVVIFQYSRW